MKVRTRADETPCFWQWPNVLGIDAALIAVSWYWLLLPNETIFPTIPALVLALSVWLTYLADRLFDVRGKELTELRSLRHRFVARHKNTLWTFWWFLLLINLSLALKGLNEAQLMRGLILLLVTLAYTFGVQKIKPALFQKELLVGLIFSAGVLIFLNHPPQWLLPPTLVFLFTGNCLLVTEFDPPNKNNRRQTICRLLNPTLLMIGIAALLAALCLSIALSAVVLLLGIYSCRHILGSENGRILADASLLVPPLLSLICQWGF